MKNNDFKYNLRLCIQPGHHVKERLSQLVLFCREAKIDDVTVHINCEELNKGHLSIEETKPWMELVSIIKETLKPEGITVSINPWTTILHADRGRKLSKDQNFILMKDPKGKEASAVVCPLCPEWRHYITEMYAYYALAKPDILWVEDDFRLHNHEELEWGGCFCDRHMELFSNMAGKKLSREEFVNGILQPGNPHPYRKIWLSASRDTMVELAGLIGQAVHAVSPETRVGLMSSCPNVHCAEGRDWEGILRGLSGGNIPVDRPHLPSYSDATPQGYLWNFEAFSRQTVAMVPPETQIYPELEGYPYTNFTKSKKFMGFQIETTAILGSDGITLNISDMMGNGIAMKEGYQNKLSEIKPFISAIKSLSLNSKRQSGVKVLISDKSAYTLITSEGIEMSELYPEESFWASLLSAFGIANTYSLTFRHKRDILAISGQYLRNLTTYSIEQLFQDNFVILEGDAAFTLHDMGLGHLAGIRNALWHKVDNGFVSYEQVCNGHRYSDIDEARVSSQLSAGDFLEIEYNAEPEIWTEAKNYCGNTVAKGLTVFEGRVLIYPYGHMKGKPGAHLNTIRQELLQHILSGADRYFRPVMAEGSAYTPVYCYEQDMGMTVIVANFSYDDTDSIKLYIPGKKVSEIEMLDRLTCGKTKVGFKQDKDGVIINKGVKGMELAVLILRTA